MKYAVQFIEKKLFKDTVGDTIIRFMDCLVAFIKKKQIVSTSFNFSIQGIL